MTEKNTNPAGNPRIAEIARPGMPQPREFERFAELTGKLAKVPKSELDAKRKR